MGVPTRKSTLLLVCAALALATFAAYIPVLFADFTNYDDPQYVYQNPHVRQGLGLKGVVWAFTDRHSSYWHPVTWISLMLDCSIFGVNPQWHHRVNLLLHIASSILLFIFLSKATGQLWPSGFVAAVFALHPLHVESVAWVVERKDVLSTFFWMLSVLAYLGYVKRRNLLNYLVLLLVFAAGLMSKPMLVTLPCVLLLLDYWPLRRVSGLPALSGGAEQKPTGSPASGLHLIAEKLPLFALAAASSTITMFVLHRVSSAALPPAARIENALIAYATYIAKVFWPTHLAVFYPHRVMLGADVAAAVKAVGAAALLLVLTFTFVRLRKKAPWLLVGWLWFLGTLFPVIGIIQSGGQALADRFSYVPLIGLTVCITWAFKDFLSRVRVPGAIPGIAAVIVLAAAATGTAMQTLHWKNSKTLFEHAIAVTQNNYVAHEHLGYYFASQGEMDKATEHFRKVLQIRPGYTSALNGLGLVLIGTGKADEAIKYLDAAVKARPDYADAMVNLGTAFAQQGKPEQAIPWLEKAVQLEPDSPVAHSRLGVSLAAAGNAGQALVHLQKALELGMDDPAVYYNLGLMAIGRTDYDGAIGYFNKAVKLDPRHLKAHLKLGQILAARGGAEQAIEHFRSALDADPNCVDAHIQLGFTYARRKEFDKSIEHFRQALRINPSDADLYVHLGVALAGQGNDGDALAQFEYALQRNPDLIAAHVQIAGILKRQGERDKASAHLQKALKVAEDARQDKLAAQIRKQIDALTAASPDVNLPSP